LTTKRGREIREIISDLESLKLDPRHRETAEINIEFFEAARSIFGYMRWLLFVAPKLREKREKILELGDFPLEKWQRRGYEGLVRMERHRFAGMMSGGFIRELSRIILKMREINGSNEPVVMLGLGFGSGELDRRVFEKLPGVPLVYVGIDITPVNIELARTTFQPLHKSGEILFQRVPKVSDELIDTLRRQAMDTSKKAVAVCLGDIFELDRYVSSGEVDIIYHSRLLHHVGLADKPRLEDICRRLSPITVEMDDRYCFWFKFWATVVTWAMYSNVALMGDAIISGFRDPSRKELTGYYKLVSPFSYVRLIFGDDSNPQVGKWEAVKRSLMDGFSFRQG